MTWRPYWNKSHSHLAKKLHGFKRGLGGGEEKWKDSSR
jgi:hypothetical protein